MPRFVILEHDHPFQHWDLMLETGDVLRTWRLHAWPQPGTTVHAEQSFDHRLAYLDYEGPVSGGRGSVVRRDAGVYETISESEWEMTLQMTGEHWEGPARLKRNTDGNWAFQVDRE